MSRFTRHLAMWRIAGPNLDYLCQRPSGAGSSDDPSGRLPLDAHRARCFQSEGTGGRRLVPFGSPGAFSTLVDLRMDGCHPRDALGRTRLRHRDGRGLGQGHLGPDGFGMPEEFCELRLEVPPQGLPPKSSFPASAAVREIAGPAVPSQAFTAMQKRQKLTGDPWNFSGKRFS